MLKVLIKIVFPLQYPGESILITSDYANKTAGEETRWQLHKNAACNPEQVLAATPHKTPTVRPPAPYHENYSS